MSDLIQDIAIEISRCAGVPYSRTDYHSNVSFSCELEDGYHPDIVLSEGRLWFCALNQKTLLGEINVPLAYPNCFEIIAAYIKMCAEQECRLGYSQECPVVREYKLHGLKIEVQADQE